jgi:predicted PurR-regulated permease PerM
MSQKTLNSILSPLQKRFLALALTLLSICIVVGFAILLLQIAQGFVKHFSAVLWPLAVSGILALCLKPLVTLLEKKLNVGRKVAICLIYGAFIAVFATVMALVLPKIVDQTLILIENVPVLYENTRSFIFEHVPVVKDVLNKIPDTTWNEWSHAIQSNFSEMKNVVIAAAKNAGSWANSILIFGTSALLVPIYLVFFLQMDNNPLDKLEPQLTFVKKQTRKDLLFLLEEFVKNIVAYFRGQFVIALILAVFFSTGFSIVGLKFGLILGIIVGLLNMVPFLGTIFAIAVVLPAALFQPDGGLETMLMCLGVLLVVQMIQDYVLTPRIMGKETGLSPLVIIISIFFWGAALNGITGMLLAIPLTSFLIAAWKFVFRRYISNFLATEEIETAEA